MGEINHEVAALKDYEERRREALKALSESHRVSINYTELVIVCGGDLDIAITALREASTLRARLAALERAAETVLYAQLGGHLDPNKDGKACLDELRAALFKKEEPK